MSQQLVETERESLQQQIPELNCPICLTLFRKPITICCGHSFCRLCLITACRNHQACPICRLKLVGLVRNVKSDEILTRAVSDYHKHTTVRQEKSKDSKQNQIETLLLLDVKTDQLVLPHNRVTVTFQLQSRQLVDRLDRFVARQQEPYNKLGVISRIVTFKKLRRNLYSGTLQGISFCEVKEQCTEQGTIEEQDIDQLDLEYEPEGEYFYRVCKADEISQTYQGSIASLQAFVTLLQCVTDQKALQKVYQQVDFKIFCNEKDPIAFLYTVFGVIAYPNDKKYACLVSMDQTARVQIIESVVANLTVKKVKKNPGLLLQAASGSNSWWQLLVLLVLVIFFFYLKEL